MSHSLKIIYMGTPEFAVPPLKILYDNGFTIAAVITSPDRPAGRGLKIHTSPVKNFALANSIPILQPTNLKNEAFIQELKLYEADLQVVVAFRMLPQIVWSMPRLGTLNLHASLLPDYRGAAPINWAIIAGEKETGVTTFFLKNEIDTGDIINQKKIIISDADNAGTLHDKLMLVGADLILKTVQDIEINNFSKIPQSQHSDKKAPKIFKETCLIHWHYDVAEIKNLIRGLSPAPGAFTYLNSQVVKIYAADTEVISHNYELGHIITDNKTYLKFAAKNGILSVKELQLEGKKRMKIDEFLRGHSIK